MQVRVLSRAPFFADVREAGKSLEAAVKHGEPASSHISSVARVAKLEDAPDLESGAERHGGSNPLSGTIDVCGCTRTGSRGLLQEQLALCPWGFESPCPHHKEKKMDYREAQQKMEKITKAAWLPSDFSRTIWFKHMDGSECKFHGAKFVRMDKEWLCIITEHHGEFLYHHEDLEWVKEMDIKMVYWRNM